MLCFQTGSITVLRTCAYLLAGFMVLGAAGSALAAKTDVVTLKNGDRITGEVKRLDRGRLRYSTDDMGTIYIGIRHDDDLFVAQIVYVEA